MTAIVGNDGYQRQWFYEGESPPFVARFADESGDYQSADISSIKVTVQNVTFGTTVLDEESLTVSDVLLNELVSAEDADGDSVTYNFRWQPDASTWKCPTYHSDVQFKVEVWVTPQLGGQLATAWYWVTVRKSIVPVPE